MFGQGLFKPLLSERANSGSISENISLLGRELSVAPASIPGSDASQGSAPGGVKGKGAWREGGGPLVAARSPVYPALRLRQL